VRSKWYKYATFGVRDGAGNLNSEQDLEVHAVARIASVPKATAQGEHAEPRVDLVQTTSIPPTLRMIEGASCAVERHGPDKIVRKGSSRSRRRGRMKRIAFGSLRAATPVASDQNRAVSTRRILSDPRTVAAPITSRRDLRSCLTTATTCSAAPFAEPE